MNSKVPGIRPISATCVGTEFCAQVGPPSIPTDAAAWCDFGTLENVRFLGFFWHVKKAHALFDVKNEFKKSRKSAFLAVEK